MRQSYARPVGVLLVLALAVAVSGCGALRDFRGANSLPLPGRAGVGAGHYTIQAQMPDVQNLKENSRVQFNDVLIGNVARVERQGWHALVTMTIDPNVELPGNATATIGQTSLLGTLHIQLATPAGVPAKGKLHDGSVIPLSSAGAYPSTEQSLGALSLVLNGGGVGQLQDITSSVSKIFAGRENDVRSLIGQLDKFTFYLNDQTADIIAALESFNNLVGQFADQRPVLDKALKTIPAAIEILNKEKEKLTGALSRFGPAAGDAADTVAEVKENLIRELGDVGPVEQSLANAGLALTRGLDYITVPLFSKPPLAKWIRGDYGNLTGVFDLTLSRLDSSFFTGTRWEGNLTELEMQWGRTLGVMPSPYTARNPLVAPYQFEQGP
ncbi:MULTISPECIES: MCE family protein [Mycobacterium]|uniref:Mammalian cell entry protein n=1 Tax=Mycobacterium kiyosense TaxID=2871094 RepID=A0A9P3UVC2_9MYCO|nr:MULTISPECIES: MCE family protein [Mycobacterium]BDB44326.1 mammalian cell entry protein [Mycobacterium kiyosense]BDE15851.1 mammalian cell entry protein [Mycobacterium sp. 20KCMC460]GLB80755.1 mammalian cell entry protein [Mycobacterium kiyosense]GLB87507.1 mammalian cell entry protein [Mycobacterium kiyosense]GLB93235.1 mammalian cell entry protein [Mycobacterium kiyosense]